MKLAQRIQAWVGPDNTVFIIAKVLPGYSVSKVIESLKEKLQGVDVYSKAAFSRKTRMYWTFETGVGYAFLITILISFLVGTLIVGQTIYNSTTEHIKEFGTLKALGAENMDVYKIIFTQAFIIALFSYLISLIITLISVKFYEAIDMVIVVKWWTNLIVFFMTFLMCFASAYISIRKIKRIDPAILFRG